MPVVERCRRTRAACILPLGLGRQVKAIHADLAPQHVHKAPVIHIRRLRPLNPLVLSSNVLIRHILHGPRRIASLICEVAWTTPHHEFPLPLCNREDAEVEVARNRDHMKIPISRTRTVGRATAHDERARRNVAQHELRGLVCVAPTARRHLVEVFDRIVCGRRTARKVDGDVLRLLALHGIHLHHGLGIGERIRGPGGRVGNRLARRRRAHLPRPHAREVDFEFRARARGGKGRAGAYMCQQAKQADLQRFLHLFHPFKSFHATILSTDIPPATRRNAAR